jgi:hypothetical protein
MYKPSALLFIAADKRPDINILKRKKRGLGSWFQRFQSMVVALGLW